MKIGVYFCNCGTIISEKIDSERVKEKVLEAGNDLYFKTFGFLCSDQGKEFLEKDLSEEKPDRIVIAACSPRDHEKTFMNAMLKAGMNPYLMQMANIREQVAWVTADKEKAIEKASAYINGALARVRLQEPLEVTELEANLDVLVIGAGPAGLKAALSLAESGRKVVLLEKSPLIGGLPVRYEDVFPTLECGPCMLEPILSDVLHGEYSRNIELLTLSEVMEVAGYYGNFIVKIRRSPRYVDESQCIGCGECITPCPVSAKNEFDCGLSERKAVSFPFLGALPNAPYIDPGICLRFKGEECRLCKDACKEICGLENVIDFDDGETTLERNVGSIILAIGSALYECGKLPNLGYGKIPDVYTNLEFERMLAAGGPTSGEIKTASGSKPAAVALIHCVGSLDRNHNEYCSETCCLSTFKYHYLISTKLPEVKIYHVYKELVMPGKEGFQLYARAKKHPNTVFIRYQDIESLTVKMREERKVIEFRFLDGRKGLARTDMIILCPAQVPSPEAGRLGMLLEVSLDRYGFLCNWCSYAGADKAGTSQKQYPPNVYVIKVMCSGRVDPQFVLQAFDDGADGVIILACHPGDCHYKEGNFRAVQRYRLLLRLLEQYGIEKERCGFDYISAGESEKYVKVMTGIVGKVKALGPIPGSQGKGR